MSDDDLLSKLFGHHSRDRHYDHHYDHHDDHHHDHHWHDHDHDHDRHDYGNRDYDQASRHSPDTIVVRDHYRGTEYYRHHDFRSHPAFTLLQGLLRRPVLLAALIIGGLILLGFIAWIAFKLLALAWPVLGGVLSGNPKSISELLSRILSFLQGVLGG